MELKTLASMSKQQHQCKSVDPPAMGGEDRAMFAYHSPLVPSPLRLGSWVLPAAAEAKLDGSGVGIMVDELFWSDVDPPRNNR
jgi:hypothetical protein